MLHSSIVVREKGSVEGYGLFAEKGISKGEQVWKLIEPTFTWTEIQAWQGQQLKDFKRYGFQCGVDSFSLPKGASREMNHSCDPNTWWAEDKVLVARRDIAENEELTYDYASCDIDLEFNFYCHCGFSACRGRISNNDYLDVSWQAGYGQNLPPHVLAAIAKS